MNGRLKMARRDDFEHYLQSLDGDVEIVVGKRRPKRSDPQNGYYWAVVVKIPADHFGYYSDEMHDAFKLMFLRREGLRGPPTIRSSAKLTKAEFGEYIDRCRMWCEEQGIRIPSPNEYYAAHSSPA